MLTWQIVGAVIVILPCTQHAVPVHMRTLHDGCHDDRVTVSSCRSKDRPPPISGQWASPLAGKYPLKRFACKMLIDLIRPCVGIEAPGVPNLVARGY